MTCRDSSIVEKSKQCSNKRLTTLEFIERANIRLGNIATQDD